MKINTATLLEALSKQSASAARAANITKNATIKQCHEQMAAECSALEAAIQRDYGKIMEVYITAQEPKTK